MNELLPMITAKLNYWIYIILLMIGLYGVIAKKNLIKKIIGMNILQTAVILFYISTSAKNAATIPIILHDPHAHGSTVHALDYINPLPHVLMLTAIVVAVSTLGVALAIAIRLYKEYGSLEENHILDQINRQSAGQVGITPMVNKDGE